MKRRRPIAKHGRLPKPRPPTDVLAQDEELALEYLAGKFEKNECGEITLKFHEPGSKEEAESRAAFIRLLRGRQEISPMIRLRWAALLDPNHRYEERIFTIKKRRPGMQPRHAFMIEIARFIAVETSTGRKMESAKEAAKQRYGVSMSTVDRAWINHRDFCREVWIDPIKFGPDGSN